MTNFKIKYLYEIYPDLDFTEEWVQSQDISFVATIYETQATDKSFGHVFDNIKTKRHIQTIIKDKYEIKLVAARNIDINKLAVAVAEVTTENGETFFIYDVEVESEKTNGHSFLYTITFYKYNERIINHLSSTNAELYTGSYIINFKIRNPYFIFNHVLFEFIPDGYNFKVPLTNLTDLINIHDTFYVHTANAEYKALTDNSIDLMSLDKTYCYDKDENYVYFTVNANPSDPKADMYIDQLIIDNEYEYYQYPNSFIINDKEIEFNIYTFLQPLKDVAINEIGSIELNDLAEYPGGTIINEYLIFRIFLKNDELYKIHYLQNADEITLNVGGEVVVPFNKFEIIEKKDTELIDMYEFELKFKTSHLARYNNQRTY